MTESSLAPTSQGKLGLAGAGYRDGWAGLVLVLFSRQRGKMRRLAQLGTYLPRLDRFAEHVVSGLALNPSISTGLVQEYRVGLVLGKDVLLLSS